MPVTNVVEVWATVSVSKQKKQKCLPSWSLRSTKGRETMKNKHDTYTMSQGDKGYGKNILKVEEI